MAEPKSDIRYSKAGYRAGYRHGIEEMRAADAESGAGESSLGNQKFERIEVRSSLSRYGIPIVLVYLAAGTCFYSWAEDWPWVDALYFCTLTVTTVGYGDLVPTTDTSKIVTVGFITIGLSVVASCLGIIMGQLTGLLQARMSESSRTTRHIWQVVYSIVTVVFIVLIGAIFAYFTEGWSMIDCVYWAVVTVSSVGYGDLTILSESTRQFAIVYMLFGVGGFAVSLSKFGTVIMEVEAAHAVDMFVKRGVSEAMIDEMDEDHSGSIDRIEFLTYMLTTMGKVDKEDITKILGVFDALDLDGSGSIDKEDIRLQEKQQGVRSTVAASMHDPPYIDVTSHGSNMVALKKPLLPT